MFKESKNNTIDDHYVTIGDCNVRVATKGKLKHLKETNEINVQITHIGIYVKDGFDYVESTIDQPLGYWNFKDNKVAKTPGADFFLVQNSNYRNYRIDAKRGMDFYWYSDIKVIDVSAFNVHYRLSILLPQHLLQQRNLFSLTF